MDKDNEVRMLALLENYGRHLDWCETQSPNVPPAGVRLRCTCGLDGITDFHRRRLFPRMYGLPYPEPEPAVGWSVSSLQEDGPES